MNVYEKKEILLRFKKNRTRRPDDSDERRLEQEIRSAILKLKDETGGRANGFEPAASDSYYKPGTGRAGAFINSYACDEHYILL